MGNVMKKFVAAAMLFAAAGAFAADIWEIRPCDPVGNSISHPQSAWPVGDAIGSGETLYFNVRLVTRDANPSSSLTKSYFKLDHIGTASWEEDWNLNPFQIGIFVGGTLKYATYAGMRRTPLSYDGETSGECNDLMDVVFSYRTEPGDLGLPIRLALADKTPVPDNYGDRGDEGTIKPPSAKYLFRNANKWAINYYYHNGSEFVSGGVADFQFNPYPMGDFSQSPDDDSLNSNYSLKQCGFFVKTVDFEDNKNPETDWEKPGEYWKSVQKNGTLKARIEAIAAVTNAATLYVWCENEDVAAIKGGTPENFVVGYTGGGDSPIYKTFQVATVKIEGRTDFGEFTVQGVESNKTAKLILSGKKGYSWKTDGTGGTLIKDYIEVPLYCSEPLPPSVSFTRVGDEKTVTVTKDYNQSIATFNLTLSEAYTNGDGKVSITVAPVLEAGTDIQTNEYVRISDTLDTDTGWRNKGSVTLTFETLATTPVLKKQVYVYGMGADSRYTIGEGHEVNFKVIDIQPADAKVFFETVNDNDFLYLDPAAPVVTSPAAGSTIEAVGNVARKLEITVEDNYRNITETNVGYKVYWRKKQTDDWAQLGWSETGTRWGLSKGQIVKMNDDGTLDTKVLPTVTYTVDGDYQSSFYVEGPNGEQSGGGEQGGGCTITVRVSPPATITATSFDEDGAECSTFNEGAGAYVTIGLSSAYDQDVWAYLVPANETTASLVSGDCLTNSEFSAGIKISASKKTSATQGEIILEDGKVKPGTVLEFDVVLCTSSKFDVSKLVPGYKSETLQLRVLNVAPKLNNVLMNMVDQLEPREDGKLWMTGTAGLGVEKTFTFDVEEPSTFDLTATNSPTGDNRFQLRYTVKEARGGSTNEVVYGNANTNVVRHTFTSAGVATMTVELMDKDMKAKDGKFGEKTTFYVNVSDNPIITVKSELGNVFFENDIGAANGKLTLELSENNASVPLTVRLTVKSGDPTSKNPGMLKLGGCTATSTPGVYEITVPNYRTSVNFFIDEADGTETSAIKGFTITPEVITGSPNPEGTPWKDYFVSQTPDPFLIENVPPTLMTSLTSETGILQGNAGYQNTVSNAYVVGIGDADAVSWSVYDITADMGSAGSSTNITVTWQSEGRTVTTNVTTSSDFVFTPKFKTSGMKTVTVTVTDKDVRSGNGTTTAMWYYNVDASKVLMTMAHGPGGGSSSELSQHYAAAKGLGEGHIYASGKTFAGASGFQISWNCKLDSSVDCYGFGYKVADHTGAKKGDDGTLDGGRDIALDKNGDNSITDETKPITFECYKYSDPVRDSFLYCWIQTVFEDGLTTSTMLGSMSPERPAVGAVRAQVGLPKEKDDSGNFENTLLEAVFSKEYLPTDNCGDINQDGVPDVYVSSYRFDVIGDDGKISGDDTKSLEGYNEDGDYLPIIMSETFAHFVPALSNSWVSEGRKFGAKLEIRGWGDGLNDAVDLDRKVTNIKTEKVFTDPAVDTNSTLNALEWDAYKHLTDAEKKTWSPERPTDPTIADTDEDGLPDGYEYYIWYKATVGYMDGGVHKYFTGRRYNPSDVYNPDIITSKRIAEIFDPLSPLGSDWDTQDTDNDGIPDAMEFLLGTNPFDFDTDGDWLPDGYEVFVTKTDPLKYATDDSHCDATLNPDNDSMAVSSEMMHIIGVQVTGGTAYYCAFTNFETVVDTSVALTGTVFRTISTIDAEISTNVYLTSEKVVVGDDGCLVGDLSSSKTWYERFTADGKRVRGVGVSVTRGTPISEIAVEQEYFNETVTPPDKCYTAWRYGDGFARGRKGWAAGGSRVQVSDYTNNVKWIHYQVRELHPYDPRTGWKDGKGSVNSAPFSNLDEFLTMQFFYRTGGISAVDLQPTIKKPLTTIWRDNSTSPTNPDTDGDKMPDGWEMYMMSKRGEAVSPANMYSPLSDFNTIPDQKDRDPDEDGLEWPAEYSGVASSAKYGWIPVYPNWRNKSMPTDPWNRDTDGDGVTDGEEGGIGTTSETEGGDLRVSKSSYAAAARNFFYNDSGKAGGGLNPLSWDTDGDLLPDAWELEYHGTFNTGSNKVVTVETIDANGATNTATYTVVSARWNMDGMDGTVIDDMLDYDHDGLLNWQEYMVGAMRCWRYDDSVSGWGFNQMSTGMLPAPGTEEWGEFWGQRLIDEQNESGKFNPTFSNGYFDPIGAYFSCCTNAFDSAYGQYYMLRDGIYHDLKTPDQTKYAAGNRYTYKAALGGVNYDTLGNNYPQHYISCDPTRHDTDFDGMDDYYELFHGLNPLLGAPAVHDTHREGIDQPYDVVYDAYARPYGAVTWNGGVVSALNNWWTSTITANIKNLALGGYDFINFPWLNGIAGADPDGDGIVNQEEAIMPKVQAASTYHHTDPTPLWVTDTTYTNSLTCRYYLMQTPSHDEASSNFELTLDDDTFEYKGVKYHLSDFAGFKFDASKQTLKHTFISNPWNVTSGWAFSFEENEGYDSDHDFLSDFEEAQGKTKNASNPQNHDDPLRRQAMYFGGKDNPSFLQTPLASREQEPHDLSASEARQNFLYYTVECWAKPDADTVSAAGLQTLVERAILADNEGPADERLLRKNFLIGIKDGKWYTRFDTTGADDKQGVEITAGPLATTDWTHIAATYDGTALKLYVNGVCKCTEKTSIQPEHGMNALAINSKGEMNPNGGTLFSDMISIIVGASAVDEYGIVYDYAWRTRRLPAEDPSNPEGLGRDTDFNSYGNYYKGYIDEVRIWDGASSAEDIYSNYVNRVRYTAELASANRQAVYAQWRLGGLRSPASAVQLPPELMYHWSFDHLAGAIDATDVIKVPAGFNTAKTITDAKARWVRPADWTERCWESSLVRSTVYDDAAWVPWINNTVSHLPRFDLTTLDSVYWSEDYAGYTAPATNDSYTSFSFPRSNEVISRWTQIGLDGLMFYDNHFDRDFSDYNNPNASIAKTYAYTGNTRWYLVTDYEEKNYTTELSYAYRFAMRNRNLVGDDILPMGGAYPKRISMTEGGMWYNPEGEDAKASDVWAQTGADADNDSLPDWWEAYARQNYCKNLRPRDPLNWDTIVTYYGVQMTALEAYLRDLAKGLIKDGSKITYDEAYADTRDNDHDGLPDWWEELYHLAPDLDCDGIADEDEITFGTDKKVWDTDGDGMPDGWEAIFAGTVQTNADAHVCATGDVMAFATIDARFITIDKVKYMLAEGAVLPSVGSVVSNLQVYTTYTYPVWENDAIVEYIGVGTNLVLNADATTPVTSVISDGTAVLVHSQVYERFGFNPTTATPMDGAANTKPFTALDKYLVLRYLTALGKVNEASVNALGVMYDTVTAMESYWAKTTLKPFEIDFDVDGIPDGWELYVGADPWNYDDRNSDKDGDGLTLVEEYDHIISDMATDPNNEDTLGYGIGDKATYDYDLKGDDGYRRDRDNDQLSNFAEYMISSMGTLGFPTLDAGKIRTNDEKVGGDQVVPDYFLPHGSLYLGEMFADHDMIEDWFEDGNNEYSRYVYEAHLDADDDGWNNWQEARARIGGGTTNIVSSVVTNGAVCVTNYIQAYNYDLAGNCPVPEVPVTLVCNDKVAAGATVVIKAWSQENKNDAQMIGYPDATWVVKTVGGHPLRDQITLSVATNGYLRSGRNMFVAYVAAGDEALEYVPGQPYGVVRDIDVDFLRGQAFTLEMTLVNAVMPRINLIEMLDLQAAYATSFDPQWDWSKILDPENGEMRTAYYQNLTSYYIQACAKTDRGINYNTYAKLQGPEYIGTNVWNTYAGVTAMWNDYATSSNVQIRIIRSDINGKGGNHIKVDGTKGETIYFEYGSDKPCFERMYNLLKHPVISEADLIADGIFDFDWGTIADAFDGAKSDLVSATYRIVISDGTTELNANNNNLAVCIQNCFERQQTAPANLLAQSYGGKPTFSWTHENTIGKLYPAFQLQVKEGKEVVYDSGVQLAPARDSNNRYSFTAPIVPGMMTAKGKEIKADVEYTWSVAMLDAKFSDITKGAAVASGKFTLPNSGALSDYGSIAVAVKYMGPASVATEGTAKLLRVAAYDSPDFSGIPVGEGYVAHTDSLKDTYRTELNAIVNGLPKNKTYYVLAYLDTNGNGKQDVEESWGYANYVGTDEKNVYTPYPVELIGDAKVPECVIYVEDADTNNNKLPDAWELEHGGLGKADVDGQKSSPYIISIDGSDAVATNLLYVIGQAGAAKLPYYSTLEQFANGKSVSSISLALAMSGIDVNTIDTTPSVKISSFSLSDGIEFSVDARATVDGKTLTPQAVIVKVNLTISVEYATSLAGNDWKVAATAKTQVQINGTYKVSADELIDQESGKTVTEVVKEAIAAHPEACFFRANVSIDK